MTAQRRIWNTGVPFVYFAGKMAAIPAVARKSWRRVLPGSAIAVLAGLALWWFVRPDAVMYLPLESALIPAVSKPVAAPPSKSPANTAQAAADSATAADARPALLANAFRGTDAEALADQQRLAQALDLRAFAAELEQRAARGDIDAAATLFDLLHQCAEVFALSADTQAAAPIHTRCATLLDGQGDAAMVGLQARLDAATDRAALLGDPAAGFDHDLQQAAQGRGFSEDDLIAAGSVLANRLLDQGRLADLWRMARGSAAVGLRHDSRAWVLALCQLGYPCNELDFSIQGTCAQIPTGCSASDPVGYVRERSSDRTWRRLQAERDEILAAWARGERQRLITRPGGGG
jgi:hypothetical protein